MTAARQERKPPLWRRQSAPGDTSSLRVGCRRSAGIAPGNEGRHEKVFGSAAVLQGPALRGFYCAAGSDDERVARGHFLLAGFCEGWIDSGLAFRDLAELNCGAAGASLDWPK